jgi:hypothetical protein
LLEFLDLPYQYNFEDDDLKPVNAGANEPRAIEEASSSSSTSALVPPDAVFEYEFNDEDDLWPLFPSEAVQSAAIAALLLYGLGVFYGYLTVAKTTMPRMALTVAMLTYWILLLQRISQQQ